MKPVTAYKCDYCARCFLRPCNAMQHESSCNANPARKNCKTCVHGCYGNIKIEDRLTVESYYPGSGYPNERIEMIPYCDYHKVPIFEKPYNIECESSMRYGDEVPDAGTCYYYKYKGKRGWTQKDAPEEKP